MLRPKPIKPEITLLTQIRDLLIKIEENTSTTKQRINEMALDLTELAAEVDGMPDVVASVERVLTELVDQLNEAGGNQAEVDRIKNEISEQKTRLAEAIANVGPVEPPAPTEV